MINHIIVFLLILTSSLFSAPSAIFDFDEWVVSNYPDLIEDSQNSHDGFANMVPSINGSNSKICRALDLRSSSTNDYASLGANSLDGAGDFTVSIWLKGTSSNGRSLLSGARSGQDNAFLLWFGSATNMSIYINNGGIASFTIPSIADGNWHHFAIKRTGSTICTFVDGVSTGACKTSVATVLDITSLILGQEQDNVGGGFNTYQDWEGIVDELLTFKSALSNAEILSIYNNQNAGNNWDNTTRSCQAQESVDMGYSDWHFDESDWNGTANEVVDSAGNNHGVGHSVSSVESGKLCTAVDLTPSSITDYITLGADSLDKVANFTVSIWHKGISGDDSNGLLSGAGSHSINEHLFWFTNPTKFGGHIRGPNYSVNLPSTINNNTWQHLVWRREGRESCFFRDGALIGCRTTKQTRELLISSLILGQEQDSVGNSFDPNQDWEGKLDELIIFRRALSDAAITSIYTNQNIGKNWDGSTRICPNAIMSIVKDSCVLEDPISGTNNPKTIPGATVRYSFEVNNTGERDADDVILSDTVENKFNISSIVNLQIQSGLCNCAGVSSASNNGVNGSANGANPVQLDFGTIVSGTVATPTTKCGYFEVDLQ